MSSLGDLAKNNSKGCGGVMRVAPVGLFCYARKSQHAFPNRKDYAESSKDRNSPFELGNAAAAITHGHPTGFLTAGVFSSVIYLLLKELSLREAVVKKEDGRFAELFSKCLALRGIAGPKLRSCPEITFTSATIILV